MLFRKNRKATKVLPKVIILVAVSLVLLALVCVLLVSKVSKHLIEKYDVEYTGRKIKVDRVYANPFTGYIHLSNLKIYESDSLSSLTVGDSVFFSAKGVSVNIAMLKLLRRTFEISSITLNQPKGVIIQNKSDKNINDLIEKLSSKKTDTIPSKNRFSILDIKIVNGEFHYIEKLTPIDYSIKKINLDSNGKHWNSDSIATSFSFLSQSSTGSIKGSLTYNLSSKKYSLAILVNKFDFELLDQYFKDLSNFGSLRATLDADFSSVGNLNDPEDVTNKGILVINDLHLEKNANDDYVSFSKLAIGIKEMSPNKLIYLYDSIEVTEPYIKYEKYDYLDNLQMMFGKDWAKITEVQSDTTRFNLILRIVDQIKIIRKNLPKSDFQFNKVAIVKGIVEYNNFTQNEKFSIEANPLYIRGDSIYKTQDRIHVYLKSGLHPYGSLSASLSINPKDKSDFDLKYDLKGVPASLFNPFTIAHASYPLDRGTLELNGKLNVQNGDIKSNNNLLVIDPRLGKQIKIEENDWLPLPLIMYLVRGKGNVIDFDIPITGNLKDPKFIWKEVISDVAKNLFTKPTSTSYRALVKDTEAEIEKSLTLKWELQQNTLYKEQERFVNNLVNHLLKNPESSVDIYPILYAHKELEYNSFFEAKKKYFLLSKKSNNQTLSHADSLEVNKVSIKNTLFLAYLDKQANNNLHFTVQDKCNSLIGSASLNANLKRLGKLREDAIMDIFRQKGVESRVTIHPEKITTPYNGYSNYKIAYKGELPKNLTKAYQEMDELNADALRKKYEKKRDRIE
jgi:hypothetical protein